MFINKYPYTDTHELNLDWILAEVKRLQERIDNFETSIMDEVKVYVDSVFDPFAQTIQQQVNNQNLNIVNFENYVQNQLNGLQHEIDLWENRLESNIAAVNMRTDLRIQQNNDYIINYMSQMLRTLTVINYFTGDETSIQDMFDYLAQFHLANSINYNQFYAKNNTYTQLLGYNMTYTQLVNSGNIIIT